MKRLWTTGYRAYELGVFDEKDPKVAVIKDVLQKQLRYQLDSTSDRQHVRGVLADYGTTDGR